MIMFSEILSFLSYKINNDIFYVYKGVVNLFKDMQEYSTGIRTDETIFLTK